jgi:hypothetical protein
MAVNAEQASQFDDLPDTERPYLTEVEDNIVEANEVAQPPRDRNYDPLIGRFEPTPEPVKPIRITDAIMATDSLINKAKEVANRSDKESQKRYRDKLRSGQTIKPRRRGL